MRHSSWTVFLVPLALALVVLLLPGSLRSPNPTDSTGVPGYGQLQEESWSSLEATVLPSASSEETSDDISEALYKD